METVILFVTFGLEIILLEICHLELILYRNRLLALLGRRIFVSVQKRRFVIRTIVKSPLFSWTYQILVAVFLAYVGMKLAIFFLFMSTDSLNCNGQEVQFHFTTTTSSPLGLVKAFATMALSFGGLNCALTQLQFHYGHISPDFATSLLMLTWNLSLNLDTPTWYNISTKEFTDALWKNLKQNFCSFWEENFLTKNRKQYEVGVHWDLDISKNLN